jgi:hypothetical protein
LTTAIADRPDDLRACLAVAGDWLAVGLDPRPDARGVSLAPEPTADCGRPRRTARDGGRDAVRPEPRGRRPDLERTRRLVRSYDAEILVAGGVRDLDGLRRLRDAGVRGVILGEALFSGTIEYQAALEAAA